jgi:SAM-dependent methyltransferase
MLDKIATAYYEVDFQNSSIAEKYAKVMALPPEKSDNAERVKRIHGFANEWFSKANVEKNSALNVLDIGAGTGVFLARFLQNAEDFRWKAFAVESDPMACEHLRSLDKFDVIEGQFPTDFKLGKFDLCTLNKVVEHIGDPLFFMEKIKDVLNPERGVLYIEVPDKLTINFRPPEDNILGALYRHLYDPKSLAFLLQKAGFETISIMRFFEPSGKISVAAFATLASVVKSIVQ